MEESLCGTPDGYVAFIFPLSRNERGLGSSGEAGVIIGNLAFADHVAFRELLVRISFTDVVKRRILSFEIAPRRQLVVIVDIALGLDVIFGAVDFRSAVFDRFLHVKDRS